MTNVLTPHQPRPTNDPIWEQQIYGQGQHLNRYPYDTVVTFVFRQRPRDKTPSETHILEVGCGAGNNLLFAAREGFRVAGIDGSQSAISHARQRFEDEQLPADLHVGDFTALPFENDSFDLVIDRGSLTCTGRSAARQAVADIWRVLKPNGKFHFNPYAADHTSAVAGEPADDELVANIGAGSLVGVGQICFYSRDDMQRTLAPPWNLVSLVHRRETDYSQGTPTIHSEWRAVACKAVT